MISSKEKLMQYLSRYSGTRHSGKLKRRSKKIKNKKQKPIRKAQSKKKSKNVVKMIDPNTNLRDIGVTLSTNFWHKWKMISKRSKWFFTQPDILETVIEENIQLPLGVIDFRRTRHIPFNESYLGTLNKGDILRVSKIIGRSCFAEKRKGVINSKLENEKLVKKLKDVWEE